MSHMKKKQSFQSTQLINTQISINTLIVWLFCLQKFTHLDEDIKIRIKNLYGISKNFLNPNFQPELLSQVLKNLQKKDRKYVIKLCIHYRCLKIDQMINIINKSQIIEICLFYDEKNEVEEIEKVVLEKISKKIYVTYSKSIKKIIDIAAGEVEDFTKPFRTQYNSICLTQENKQDIHRYRFRLMACINIDKSDQRQAEESFKKFCEQKFTSMRELMNNPNYQQHNRTKDLKIFEDYQQAVRQYKRQRQLTTNFYQLTQISIKFWNKIIKIYQLAGFFHHFLNKYLRLMKQKLLESNWTGLSQPFSNMYQSIKNLYKICRNIDPTYYKNKINTVYRGGRIKYSEVLNLIKSAILSKKKAKQDLEDIDALVEDIFNGKKKIQNANSDLYIQFFGFVSTTRSLSIAINRFLQQKQQIDEKYQMQSDYDCIFKINIKYNEEIHKEQYDHLLHGFFKFAQNHEKDQEEVLFNALNIFKLVSIERKMIVDGQLVDYSYENQRNKLIYLIELQYGSFFELLFRQNIESLSEYQKSVRMSYCYCYNKIRKRQKYDKGDAFELTDQLAKSQQYYQSKVKSRQCPENNEFQIQYEVCKLDKKNYFAKLSQTYDNQGKSAKAAIFSGLSIYCYQYIWKLQEYHLYLKHSQKLFEMRQKAIDLFEREENIFEIKQEIKKQKLLIKKMQAENHPSVLLRKSELLLKKGILSFQKGELSKSYISFSSCEKEVTRTLLKCKQIQNKFPFKEYLLNIVCCSKYSDKYFLSPCNFANHVRQVQVYSKQEQNKLYDSILHKTVNFLLKAISATSDQIRASKSDKEYIEILKNFKSQLSMASNQNENQINFNVERNDELREMIKKQVLRLQYCQQDTQEYKRKVEKITEGIARYKYTEKLTIKDSQIKDEQDQFIEQYIKRQRENRIELLKMKKMKEIKQTWNYFNKQYDDLLKEVQKSMQELQQDHFSQFSSKMTEKRRELAQIAFLKSDYSLSKKLIEQLLLFSKVDGEVKYVDRSRAFKLKGRLLIKQHKYEEAIQELNESLDLMVENIKKHHGIDEKLKQQFSKDAFSVIKTIWKNEDFIQAILLKCKACLYYCYHSKKKNPNRIQTLQKLIKQKVDRMMRNVEQMITQLMVIMEVRIKYLKISELEIQYPEIRGLFYLIYYKNQKKQIKSAFEYFQESIKYRNQLYSDGNAGNLILCSQIIYSFAERPEVYQMIVKHQYLEKINKYYEQINERSNYKWKLSKARFFMEVFRPTKQMNNTKVADYLNQTISTMDEMDSLQAFDKDKSIFELKKIYEEYCREETMSKRLMPKTAPALPLGGLINKLKQSNRQQLTRSNINSNNQKQKQKQQKQKQLTNYQNLNLQNQINEKKHLIKKQEKREQVNEEIQKKENNQLELDGDQLGSMTLIQLSTVLVRNKKGQKEE